MSRATTLVPRHREQECPTNRDTGQDVHPSPPHELAPLAPPVEREASARAPPEAGPPVGCATRTGVDTDRL